MQRSSPTKRIVIHTESGEQCLEYYLHGEPSESTPTAVFLHEGLGSVASWQDLPQQLARRCGCATLTYSRAGYGRSRPLVPRRKPRYLHDEALLVLPALLKALNIGDTWLIGHSDGASIALLHAAAAAGAATHCRALVAIAPHVLVEALSLQGIERAVAEYEQGPLRLLLARLHDDVEGCFYSWADVWRSDGFNQWSIEADLIGIRCPMLLIQGEDDPYGSLHQLSAIEAAVTARIRVDRLVLAGVRHAPHLESRAPVMDRIAEFVMSAMDDSPTEFDDYVKK